MTLRRGGGATTLFNGEGEPKMIFEFQEGQCVNHISGSMSSIVMERQHTARGREHYRLWRTKPEDRRSAWFLGDFLRETIVGGEDCADCPMRGWCLRPRGLFVRTSDSVAY